LPRLQDRDQPFEAALKRELRSRLMPGGSHCPDEATLAAYADGSLSAAERAGLDSHCAGCSRCQSILAAIARAGLPDDRREPSAHHWRLYGAIAAALAGLSIVAGLIGTGRMTAISRKNQMRLAASRVVKESHPPAEIALNEARPPSSEPQERTARPDRLLAAKRPACCAPSKGQVLSGNAPSQPHQLMRSEIAQSSPSTEAPVPPAAVTPNAPGSPAAALSDSSALQNSGNRLAPSGAPSNEQSGPGSVAGFAMAKPKAQTSVSGSATIPIRTPDGIERWRLERGATIMHREPDGSWQTQSAGAAEVLYAGAAPSPDVCWIVGSDGAILRTTDGVHWQKVSTPAPNDLTSVFAADAWNATVTAANGSRFATKDGGKTWRRVM
jgi:hypothetical protein